MVKAETEGNVKAETRRRTNWYVITGGPCSGKTTTINMLAARGYKTTVEDARHYLDSQIADGKTVEEIENNHREFQQKILTIQIVQENSLNPDEIVFLDRAIPDALAYYRFLGLKEDDELTDALRNATYKKIFILAPLLLINDYARREDPAAQKRIHELITEVYESLPFPVVHVPAVPPEGRVDFILSNL